MAGDIVTNSAGKSILYGCPGNPFIRYRSVVGVSPITTLKLRLILDKYSLSVFENGLQRLLIEAYKRLRSQLGLALR